MNRRELILAGSWAALTLPARHASAFQIKPRFQSDPFVLGVASGDPLPDSVVLWTRLISEGLRDNVAVQWELAEDDQFRKIVRKGQTLARPDLGHSVHVEPAGLKPSSWYFYRFRASDAVSPVGRTRTSPSAGSNPEKLNFAFASCQNFQSGHYTAYRHMVKEDIELIVFLGDYIYEGGPSTTGVRKHSGPEIRTLNDYRARYIQYKSDPLLKDAHRLFPWIVVWDDHEVVNNWAGRFPSWNRPDEHFMERLANGVQAFYEHMPLRRTSIPSGPRIQLYRRLDYGNLARFHVIDARQFRSRQACGDGTKVCPDAASSDLTMLGESQEKWLFDGLSRSRSHWNVIANQMMMTKVDRIEGAEEGVALDDWGGYDHSRRRLAEFLGQRKPSGPLVITGNNHHHFAGDMKIEYRDERAPVLATELLGGSISSAGDRPVTEGFLQRWQSALKENPQVKYFDSRCGYVVCQLTPTECQADFRSLRVRNPDQPLEGSVRFVVESRQPGANRASV